MLGDAFHPAVLRQQELAQLAIGGGILEEAVERPRPGVCPGAAQQRLKQPRPQLAPPETRRDRHPESERLALQQHLVSFTPPGAEAITCHSPLKTVSAAAFAVPRGKHEGYTLHVANFGAETSLDIAGLPYRIRRLDVVETSQGVCFRTRRAVPCKAGIARVTLPALSLTTFTTR